MLKRILIVLLLVQAAAALGLALAARQAWGLDWWAALATGVGAVLALRLLISLHNFYLSWRAGSAVPPPFKLSPLGWLGLVLYEFHASLAASSIHMLHSTAPHVAPGGAQPPVLLLHGYACNSGYWTQLSARLRQAGISHLAPDLEPLGADIDHYVAQVQASIEQLCAAAGARQVVIVAHSMGGLVARAYLRRHGGARVARLITLGTPHHGTALASWGLGRNAAQMRHHSAWLRALDAADANSQRGLITSIYSHHDNIVAPQDSSQLAGARHVAVGAIGHVALGRHPAIARHVLDEIAAVPPAAQRVDSPGQLR
ncbi:MAG TPA: alpha/beta fold hydrolase [Burkholderiaceae bacterium]|nr:alpha/beta fold hydrolase [Burkholderiaceae bacterium]